MEPVWYLKKAEERLDTAKWAFKKDYMNSAVSNCYYALFNAMQVCWKRVDGGMEE